MDKRSHRMQESNLNKISKYFIEHFVSALIKSEDILNNE